MPDWFILRMDLRRAATPALLLRRPIHRWFGFPHSYSPELVEAILDAWELPTGSRILDPFCGAGTTLLVARERSFEAVGADISPLAVLVSRAKTRWPGRPEGLRSLQRRIERELRDLRRLSVPRPTLPPVDRLARAFTPREWAALSALRAWILEQPPGFRRDLMRLAALRILPRFSRAMADGGWFRWVSRPESRPKEILEAFEAEVRSLIGDLKEIRGVPISSARIRVRQLDAREIDRLEGKFDALITSPPYPNRHDYTRVFHIELLFLGYTEKDILRLRWSSLRSHVEARQPKQPPDGYTPPLRLQSYLESIAGLDPRVQRMVAGYFEDLFRVLRSARRILKPGARVALVVGNARYGGQVLPVDELTAEVGERAGYRFEGAWVIRLRGNSAQQMGRYGRVPSRESVVLLRRKP